MHYQSAPPLGVEIRIREGKPKNGNAFSIKTFHTIRAQLIVLWKAPIFLQRDWLASLISRERDEGSLPRNLADKGGQVLCLRKLLLRPREMRTLIRIK